VIEDFQADSAGLQSTSTFRKLALPCQRVADDGFQIVKTRLPFERRADAVAGGDDLCRIARPAAGELDLEIDAGDASITSSTEKPGP